MGKTFVSQKAHEHTMNAVAHREKLGKMMGLPPRTDYYALAHQGHSYYLAAGSGEDGGVNGIVGAILGLFDGFHFQPGGGGACFSSLSGSLTSHENFGYIMSKSYLPWYWSELAINVQDMSATGAGFFT